MNLPTVSNLQRSSAMLRPHLRVQRGRDPKIPNHMVLKDLLGPSEIVGIASLEKRVGGGFGVALVVALETRSWERGGGFGTAITPGTKQAQANVSRRATFGE